VVQVIVAVRFVYRLFAVVMAEWVEAPLIEFHLFLLTRLIVRV